MINIDWTVGMQAVNFLVMLVLLNTLVFRPILRAAEQREAKMTELERSGRQGDEETSRLMAKYDQAIVDIRRESAEMVAGARAEAVKQSTDLLAAARAEFNGKLVAARNDIDQQVDVASAQLKSDMRGFADTLAAKILGRKA
jgi:F-type H+-transporting ATPase subunit b